MRLLSWPSTALVRFRVATPLWVGNGRAPAGRVRRLAPLAHVRRDRRVQVGSKIHPAATAAETPLDDFPDLHIPGLGRFPQLQTRTGTWVTLAGTRNVVRPRASRAAWRPGKGRGAWCWRALRKGLLSRRCGAGR